METNKKYEADERDRDVAERVKNMGSNIRPEEVAMLRAVWPNIVKEVGKLEERTGANISLPRSAEDLILGLADKKSARCESVLKNVNLSVIPLTDDLRKILQDLLAK